MSRRTVRRTVVAMLLAGVAAPAQARAGEIALGITAGTSPELVRFDTAAPETLLERTPLTGLAFGESVSGLDMRPATGELWAVTSAGRMLVVDGDSGQARQVGVPL